MKVVVQRVSKAKVEVSGNVVGQINEGLLLLVGFTHDEKEESIDWMVNKIVNLRVFDDCNEVMNLSLKDVKGSILSVSQFTLYADASKGNRPTYMNALGGDKAIVLYDKFNNKLREKGIIVEQGIFGEDMQVTFTNDGPVTIVLEK